LKPVRALLTVLLGACASPASGPAGALVVVDDIGDTLRLARPAARIVSLSPATTELVFALGAGDRLVGRTRWCDFPPAALAVPSVGDGLPPNVEAVVAAAPDLVLLYRSPQNAPARARFREAGVPTLTLSFDHLGDVARLARLLGPVVARAEAGDSLALAFEAAIAAARARTGAIPDSLRPRVLILAWDQPPIAIGAGSFQSEILTLAGARNLFADLPTPSAPVSIEAIAARDPDLILLSDSGGLPAFARRPEWAAVGAVRDRRFARLPTPAFGRPSPRALEVVQELETRLAEAVP
jgi:ABC-type Fe3+-hydroxamate transport system substrate-binding protein